MKRNSCVFSQVMLLALFLLFVLQACRKDKDPDDSIGNNPTKEKLTEAMLNAVLDMRLALDNYFDAVGVVGREIYRFSPTEQRYTTDLLGAGSTTLSNNQFYITGPWRARYEVIKQAMQVIQGANRSTKITDAELRGYTGVAKTIIAHELLMNLNMTYTNGIYISLAADNPASGPVVPYAAALDTIARLLNEAKTVLAGSALPLLPTGFQGFHDAPGFIKFNRALAARVAIYRQQAAAAMTALNESFFDLNGDGQAGIKHTFATFQGDILNPCYIPQNETGSVRLAHPSYAANISPGDDRIGKATLRTGTKSQDGLASNRDVWIYPINVTGIPLIRNEELILIYAEAKIQLNQIPDAIVALNRIRTSHNLPVYAGAITQSALRTEMLKQRHYSLFFEGHYWIDMRRYGRLNELPIDRAGDDVWEKFPLPGN